jgi:hypothetical protein
MMVSILEGTVTRDELTSLMFRNGTAEIVAWPKDDLFPRRGVFQGADRESGSGTTFNVRVSFTGETNGGERRYWQETFFVKVV